MEVRIEDTSPASTEPSYSQNILYIISNTPIRQELSINSPFLTKSSSACSMIWVCIRNVAGSLTAKFQPSLQTAGSGYSVHFQEPTELNAISYRLWGFRPSFSLDCRQPLCLLNRFVKPSSPILFPRIPSSLLVGFHFFLPSFPTWIIHLLGFIL